MNRKKICFHYLRFHFILNVLAQVGVIYDLFVRDTQVIYLSLLIFFRAYSVFHIDSKIKRRLYKYRTITAIYKVISLFIMVFFVGHFIACIFMGVSINLLVHQRYNPQNTWIASYDAYQIYPPTLQDGNSLSVYQVHPGSRTRSPRTSAYQNRASVPVC